jgi:dipeptidase D
VGTVPVNRVEKSGEVAKIRIHGLKGGHSGEEIDKNRTNAVVLLGRLLHDLQERMGAGAECFRLICAEGGNKDNVIPCEAWAEIFIGEGRKKSDGNKKYSDVKQLISELEIMYKKELSAAEPGLCIDVEILEKNSFVLDDESNEKILRLLYLAESGVKVMSANVPGLVESSQNLGIFHLEEEAAEVHFSVRSSVTSAKHYLAEKCRMLIEFCQGRYEKRSEYPAWEYRTESKLRDYISGTYERMYGKKPVFQAIHAGLECGLLAEKMPELDIVSLGPDILDIHTVKERMSIASARRVYLFVRELLENWVGLF